MSILTDVRYGFRQLAKSPGFSLIAVLALALGIGANTALFSVVESIFLRPLPFAQPGELVRLRSSIPERNLNNVPFSFPRFQAVRDQQQVFSDLAVGTFTGFTITGRSEPEQVQGFYAAANYLSVLGVAPALGRFFSADEDRPGGEPVAVISHAYWTKNYNASPSVLGQALTIDGRPHTIIGVLPPALSRFPFNQIQVWAPRPAEVPFLVPQQLNNGAFAFEVVARLKPGVSLARAQEQVNVIAAAYRAAFPKNVDAPSSAHVSRWLDDLVGNQRQTYYVLFGAVGCVLLIACANVANLLLARFVGRRKEIALRFALGANRGHVIRQLVTESLLVAFAGAALGLLLAQWGVGALVKLGGNIVPRATDIGIDPVAVAFTAGVALLTGLVMGLVPAWQAVGRDVNDALKESSRGSSASVGQNRLRGGLLVGEIALSLVLLIAASLLLTSFVRLQRVSLGFQPEKVFVGFLNVPPSKYPTKPQLATFYRQLVERVAAMPGVASVALNDAPPLSGNNNAAPIAVVGRPLPPLSERPLAVRHLVSPGSFAVLGITLKAGRDFDARDTTETPHTVILNETMARKYFPGQDPIGQKLVTGMAQLQSEVVGVVSDTRSANLNTAPADEYFLPVLQRPENFTTVLVRTTGNPAGIVGSVRAALQQLDPGLPLINPQTMTDMIAASVADRRLVMSMLAAFAALALVLASIGVYSVMAYIVTQRTTEIGIRIALGASSTQVQAMVLRQGMTMVLVGIVLGLGVAAGVSRLMESLLFEIGGTDPRIYAALATFIAAVAAVACWLPARRATRVDPIIALRSE